MGNQKRFTDVGGPLMEIKILILPPNNRIRILTQSLGSVRVSIVKGNKYRKLKNS